MTRKFDPESASDLSESFVQRIYRGLLPRETTRIDPPEWPERYYNAERGNFYQPHHEEEAQFIADNSHRYLLAKGGEGGGKSVCGIIRDLERIKAGAHGIMVCVAADTLIDGIPIAERSKAGFVNTILGPALSSSSIREGRADLFRVSTQSGDQVLVTSSHRFLTPIGWRSLHDLRVGDLIAFDDSEHGRNWREIRPNSLDDYSLDHRPCDEYTIQMGQHDLDTKRQLVSSDWNSCRCGDYLDHVYIDHSFCQTYLVFDEEEHWLVFESNVVGFLLSHIYSGSFSTSFHQRNLLEFLYVVDEEDEDNVEKKLIDHIVELLYLPKQLNILFDRQSFAIQNLDQIMLQSHHGRIYEDVPYHYYNAKYTQITDITFQKHSEYYGLNVPFFGHYSAQGLFHHNSPDFTHFTKSLWPEFRRWCPWEFVVPRQRYRSAPDWEPRSPFQLNFTTGATVYCGGMKESEVMSWEGPNANWAHFDECRRHDSPAAIKVLDGRVRIPMGGYTPQIWLTTTPRKHWLFDYFGPLKDKDERASFKSSSLVMTLLTRDNEQHLEPGFVNLRRQTLTEAEARVLLEAEWEDIETGQRFLSSITLWDMLKANLPPLGKEAIVLAVDAAVGRVSGVSDCFGIVGVTRHTDPAHRDNQVFVRYVRKWQAKAGEKIDFDEPRNEIRKLCSEHSVVMVCYDRHQLHDMMQGLERENVAWFFDFEQGGRRLQSDRQLLDLILERRIWHTGDSDLKEHIDNADRKLSDDGHKLRIVKREEDLKVDLAVCLSMASFEIMRLIV